MRQKLWLFLRLLFMRPSRRAQVRRNLQIWRETIDGLIEPPGE